MRRNIFHRISIGSDLFITGDSKLLSCEVTLSEGQSISGCSFSVRASTELVDRYFTTIYKNDGLDPVVIPNQNSGSNDPGSGNPSSYDGSIPSINGVDPTKIKQAVNFYLGKGLSLEGAAYLVGNYIQESTLNHLANNDQGNIGLAQWDSGRRATNGGIPLGSGDFIKQMNWALAEMLTDSTGSGLNHNVRTKLNGSDINAIMKSINDWERFGSGELGGRFTYGAQLLEALRKGKPKDDAKDSVSNAQKPKEVQKKDEALPVSTGSQITVESGFNGQIEVAYSFLHTSISYDFINKSLTFGGQAATWILTQRVKSTAYKDCTLKQIAQKICDAHGLKLEYKGDEIKYVYFPQLGITDYECLLLECRRIGYRMNIYGNTLKLAPRESIAYGKDDKKEASAIADFTLDYGKNLTTFTVTHTAGSNSGGARSSSPSERESTGENKFELNPDTGKIEQTRKEDKTGAGAGTTGYHTATIKPLTDGTTDEKDATRRENELRIKGITADFTCPCESDVLLLTPDSIFKTHNISSFLDRVWTVEKITHSWNGNGFVSSGSVYAPMKNKYPTPDKENKGSNVSGKQGDPTSLKNPGGFIHPLAGLGSRSSGFGQRNGRLHAGLDIAAPEGTQIYASASGKVIDTQNNCVIGDSGCGGGYGNLVFIDHFNGFITRYVHCQTGSVSVSIGQTVKQGDAIGKVSDTGASRGHHLHFEIIKNGSPVDPENFISAR